MVLFLSVSGAKNEEATCHTLCGYVITCYHPSAVLVYSDARRLALEDVVPAKRERGGNERGSRGSDVMELLGPRESTTPHLHP